jgi:3-hydroxyacyl-[acyl-carrier-protein] dehydratase
MLLNDFYSLVSLDYSALAVDARISLHKEHAIFKGHFPGNPVVPGVCLMTIVKEVLSIAMEKELVLSEAKSVKFLGVINPNDQHTLSVHCEITEEDTEIVRMRGTITEGDKVFYKSVCSYKVLA